MPELLNFDRLDDRLAALDWTDLAKIEAVGSEILAELAHPKILTELVVRLSDNHELLAMCEQFDLFEKLVLHRCRTIDVRVRLHVFGDKFVEAAHNHRNWFVTRVLKGEYQHLLYGVDDALVTSDAKQMQPVFTARVAQDDTYALGNRAVHSTVARPGTVSLVIRGPSVASSFRILDLKTGQPRTRLGAADVAEPQEGGEGKIDRRRLSEIQTYLGEEGLIQHPALL